MGIERRPGATPVRVLLLYKVQTVQAEAIEGYRGLVLDVEFYGVAGAPVQLWGVKKIGAYHRLSSAIEGSYCWL